jgi:regulator of nonsense transcripts 2
MYLFTKDKLPMDVEFFVMETLDKIRPGLVLIGSYEESVEQWNFLAKILLEENEVVSDDENNEEVVEEEDGVEENYESPEEEEEEQVEEEAVIHQELEEEKHDELFDREYNRLMQDSVDSRRVDRKTAVFDAPIPTFKNNQTNETDSVSFTLLTKRGNKQQMKHMQIPADSEFAIRSRNIQQHELEERVKLKKLVLDYDKINRVGGKEKVLKDVRMKVSKSRNDE